MASQSNTQRIASKEESELIATPLYHPDNIDAIVAFKALLSTCYGPNGSLKNIHNNKGGHVTVSSVSSRILQKISFSKPVLRLIVSAIENHVRNYSDQGIFTGLLCSLIVEDFLKSNINCHLVMNMLDLCLDESLKYLNSNECACKLKLNFDNITDMIKLVKSVMCTKPLCGFTDVQMDFISRLVVETFLSTTTTEKSCNLLQSNLNQTNLQYVLLEGYNIEDAHIVDGILYETPQIPTYTKGPLTCKRLSDNEIVPGVHDGAYAGCIKVMLVDVSMAGDSSNFVEVTYELEDNIDLADAILNKLLQLAEYIVNSGVGLLACQKVIHPKVKKYLQNHEVFVLERLGSKFTKPFSILTGAKCHGSINAIENESHFGYLKNIRHCVYKSKSFVQLEGICNEDTSSPVNSYNNVCTVVLCNRNEEALQETKCVFQSALNILHLSLKEPHCLYGAGCWQTNLASYMMSQASQNCTTWAGELGTTEQVLKEMFTIFTTSLLKSVVALDNGAEHMIDTLHQHHWTIPTGCSIHDVDKENLSSCACGILKYNESVILKYIGREMCEDFDFDKDVNGKTDKNEVNVLDCFLGSLHSLQTAMATACMVLGIEKVIQQK